MPTAGDTCEIAESERDGQPLIVDGAGGQICRFWASLACQAIDRTWLLSPRWRRLGR
jgi:hypothetical protein